MFDVLKELLRVCDKHNIDLFMEGGTALGTIRHKGFIPWDDDVDVFVMREDYDRLLELLPTELGPKYAIDDWISNKDFPAPDACIYLKNSVSVPVEMKNCRYRYGIGIGLYPYDNIPDDERAASKQYFLSWFWTRLHWLKVLPFPYIPYKGFKRTVIYAICGTAHLFLKLVPKKWLVERCEKAYRMSNHMKTRRAAIVSYTYPSKSVIEKDKIYPPYIGTFEGESVKLPACWHELLTLTYGDYMQLPPEEDRKNHYPCILKFPE